MKISITTVIEAAKNQPVKKGWYHYSTTEQKSEALAKLELALKLFGDITIAERDERTGFVSKTKIDDKYSSIDGHFLDKYTDEEFEEIEKWSVFNTIQTRREDWLSVYAERLYKHILVEAYTLLEE